MVVGVRRGTGAVGQSSVRCLVDVLPLTDAAILSGTNGERTPSCRGELDDEGVEDGAGDRNIILLSASTRSASREDRAFGESPTRPIVRYRTWHDSMPCRPLRRCDACARCSANIVKRLGDDIVGGLDALADARTRMTTSTWRPAAPTALSAAVSGRRPRDLEIYHVVEDFFELETTAAQAQVWLLPAAPNRTLRRRGCQPVVTATKIMPPAWPCHRPDEMARDSTRAVRLSAFVTAAATSGDPGQRRSSAT